LTLMTQPKLTATTLIQLDGHTRDSDSLPYISSFLHFPSSSHPCASQRLLVPHLLSNHSAAPLPMTPVPAFLASRPVRTFQLHFSMHILNRRRFRGKIRCHKGRNGHSQTKGLTPGRKTPVRRRRSRHWSRVNQQTKMPICLGWTHHVPQSGMSHVDPLRSLYSHTLPSILVQITTRSDLKAAFIPGREEVGQKLSPFNLDQRSSRL
jgi:hypothetical protein